MQEKKTETCSQCNHTKVVEPARYYIPTNAGGIFKGVEVEENKKCKVKFREQRYNTVHDSYYLARRHMWNKEQQEAREWNKEMGNESVRVYDDLPPTEKEYEQQCELQNELAEKEYNKLFTNESDET